jgi:nucleotide-binding universal stress UspA family protein
MDRARVVVGVDGSEPSTAALRWAATEAWLRDVELEVLAAYHARAGGEGPAGGGEGPAGGGEGPAGGGGASAGGARAGGAEVPENTQSSATAIAEAAVVEARVIAPHATIRANAVPGPAASALIAASRDASLVVVGNRGRGGLRSLLLGSVSVQVAVHAPAAVVVVRGRGNRAYGPIVAGFDGSASAEVALGMAFEEAAVRRRGTLVAVTAYQSPLSPCAVSAAPLTFDDDRHEWALRRELIRQLARWRDKYPTVTVANAIAKGSAAAVLIEHSRAAQLIVVGTRGHGGVAGVLLGSVGQQLLHHSDCPVLIARAHEPPTTAVGIMAGTGHGDVPPDAGPAVPVESPACQGSAGPDGPRTAPARLEGMTEEVWPR